MKRVLILGALVLLIPWNSSNAMQTGIEFLRACGAAVKQADGVPVSGQESVESLWCLSYLAGFTDSLRLTASLFKPQNQKVCLPEEGTSGEQLARIVTKWLKDHPEHIHESGRIQIMFALVNAFPCK